MKHFEQLWLEAETASARLTENTVDRAIARVENLLAVYRGIVAGDAEDDRPERKEFSLKAKKKVMGEILLALASVSNVDNIDVYAALQMALSFAKLNAQQDTSHETIRDSGSILVDPARRTA